MNQILHGRTSAKATSPASEEPSPQPAPLREGRHEARKQHARSEEHPSRFVSIAPERSTVAAASCHGLLLLDPQDDEQCRDGHEVAERDVRVDRREPVQEAGRDEERQQHREQDRSVDTVREEPITATRRPRR